MNDVQCLSHTKWECKFRIVDPEMPEEDALWPTPEKPW